MRFDLHIHSDHSHDSNLSVDDILLQAVKKGLDGIAICDHNTVSGSIHAISRVKELDLPLIVIPGIEVTTLKGHLLVLGIKENIPPGLSPEEVIRIAKQKGSVVIAAHPFKIKSIGNVNGLEVDAIETFNARCIFGENEKAKQMAETLGVPEVGGSDSHLLSTIGLGYTEIDTEMSEGAVLESIKEGRTRSCGQIIPFYFIIVQVINRLSRKFKRLMKP